ncbi:MAG TPA: chloride channel protein [Longimicrobiaceae bacterium]|nr:chloride channel protein [Longimicrobiaceae bacterium]
MSERRTDRAPRRKRRLRRLHRAQLATERGWGRVVDWINARELDENTILLAFALVIGVLGALGVILFYRAIDLAYAAFTTWPGTFLRRGDLLLYRPVFTAAGLALAWVIGERFSRGREGPSVPTVQLSVARRNGDVPAGPALGRTLASAVTLGSGGSAGSEGPVAVLGATVGSVLGRLFRSDASRVKILVAAGTAAGISAAFNAPLTGAFFALEEILGSLGVGAFPPVVVSSVAAAMVSRAAFGNHPAFPVPVEYGYHLGREVFTLFPLLGAVAGLVAVLYVRAYFGVPELAERFRIPRSARPWIGGAIVGVMVWLSGGVLVGHGHLAFGIDLFGRLAWTTLALLALGKIVATAITLGMGGTGGVFTPSLYIGAVTGGSFGVLMSQLFPSLGLSPEAYALVGMGVVVAVATDAPITAILIVFEMTNDYAIMLPLMLAVVIGTIVGRRFERDSLYSGWLRRRGEHLEHGADHDVLARLRVTDAYDPNPQVIGESASVDQLLEQLGQGEQTEFPVVDPDLTFVGLITLADLGRIAKNSLDLAPLLLAADLAIPSQTVEPDDSLLDAIRKMGVRGTGSLPVTEPGTGRLRGLVTRAHILAIYQRALAGDSVAQERSNTADT